MRFPAYLWTMGCALLLSLAHSSAAPAQSGPTGMANPAAVFCVQTGGRLISAQDDRGSVRTLCQLPDGRQIEEWTFFRCSNAPRAPSKRPECDENNPQPSTTADGPK